MLDMEVADNYRLHKNYCLLKLTSDDALPEMMPGQFVQVRIDNSSKTFLRRPISINYVDRNANQLWLLIQLVGDGTRKLSEASKGDMINLLMPLGNGFTIPGINNEQKLLLVGGGVGTAPMLYLGSYLKDLGFKPCFLMGARSKNDLLQLNRFEELGQTYVTTEDGSFGEKGFVTNHSILESMRFDRIYACGPKPMMMAVAKFAATNLIACEVSLENTMACGIGACLCCVEKLKDEHHVCVCTEGPVFNINKLSWLN